ncbi:MAG: elongation factor Ts [Propionibacteriales bacterium]|nr:elongation factor Ts [Propionibacteriales bacterium]
MANFSAADVKRLRDQTGAGMMDCKNALTEADGDMERAGEILRVKGAAKVAKRGAERTAAAGLVAVSGNALVQLNCETDFVAKSEQFVELAGQVAEAADRARPADVEELKRVELAGGKDVEQTIADLAAVIGEKLELGQVAVFDGQVASYLHRKASDLPPSVGVLVEYSGDNLEAARGIAMQIAAMRPRYLTREDVPEEVVAKEREIAEETAREEGKPEQALPKIVEGRVNGFFKETVLLEQASVQVQKQTVRAVLDEAGVTVTRFARFEVGPA